MLCFEMCAIGNETAFWVHNIAIYSYSLFNEVLWNHYTDLYSSSLILYISWCLSVPFYIYLALVSSIIRSIKVALFKIFAEKNKTYRFHLENLHLIPIAIYEDKGISIENVSVHDLHNKAGEWIIALSQVTWLVIEPVVHIIIKTEHNIMLWWELPAGLSLYVLLFSVPSLWKFSYWLSGMELIHDFLQHMVFDNANSFIVNVVWDLSDSKSLMVVIFIDFFAAKISLYMFMCKL